MLSQQKMNVIHEYTIWSVHSDQHFQSIPQLNNWNKREYKNCVNNINGWLLQVKPSAETLYIIPWR